MSRPGSRVFVAVPLILAMAIPVQAGESTAVLDRGAKVRLTDVGRFRREGYVVEADREHLKLRGLDGAEWTVPTSELVQVEVARRSRARSATAGGLVGGVIFGFAGLAAFGIDRMTPRSADGKTCYGTGTFGVGTNEYPCTNGSDVASFVGVGVFLGAVIGGVMNHERYVKVQPGRVAVRVAPIPKGAAVQASVSF